MLSAAAEPTLQQRGIQGKEHEEQLPNSRLPLSLHPTGPVYTPAPEFRLDHGEMRQRDAGVYVNQIR